MIVKTFEGQTVRVNGTARTESGEAAYVDYLVAGELGTESEEWETGFVIDPHPFKFTTKEKAELNPPAPAPIEPI